MLESCHGLQESMRAVYTTVGDYNHVQDQVLTARGWN